MVDKVHRMRNAAHSNLSRRAIIGGDCLMISVNISVIHERRVVQYSRSVETLFPELPKLMFFAP